MNVDFRAVGDLLLPSPVAPAAASESAIPAAARGTGAVGRPCDGLGGGAGRRARTWVELTGAGRAAVDEHWRRLDGLRALADAPTEPADRTEP